MSECDRIDVVTTATLRPELLELTFKSFHNKLLFKCKHRRLIINIDPLPCHDDELLRKMLVICDKWFSEVIYRYPKTPSFPAAVQWVWSQVQTSIFFHLEDDWLLRKKIDLVAVTNKFSSDSRLAEVTLNPSRNRANKTPGLALRPSFFRTSFVQAALPYFDLSLDPEKQWRAHLAPDGALNGWRFELYGSSSEGRHVKDMGALWRKMHALEKWRDGEVTWTKQMPNSLVLVRMYYRIKLQVYLFILCKLA